MQTVGVRVNVRDAVQLASQVSVWAAEQELAARSAGADEARVGVCVDIADAAADLAIMVSRYGVTYVDG